MEDNSQWGKDLAPELMEVVENKGWKSPAEAIKSYANLEKIMGASRVQIPSADAPVGEWDKFWQKAGRPEDPEHYVLEESSQIGDPDWLRQTAFGLGLNNSQAKILAKAMRDKESAKEPEPSSASIKEKLQTLWGENFESRNLSAKRGFRDLFSDEQEFKNLVAAIGIESTFNLLAKAGAIQREDRLVSAGSGAHAGPISAKAEIVKLQAEAIKDRKHPYLNVGHPEHQAAVEHMQRLFQAAYTE